MEKTIKKANSKWILLFLFTFYTVGVKGQWGEYGGGSNWYGQVSGYNSVYGFIEDYNNGFVSSYYTTGPYNSDGVNIFGVTRTLISSTLNLVFDSDQAYYDYLHSQYFRDLCEMGHLDAYTGSNFHEVAYTLYSLLYTYSGASYGNSSSSPVSGGTYNGGGSYPSGTPSDPSGCGVVCAYGYGVNANCECVNLSLTWYYDGDGDGWHSGIQYNPICPGAKWTLVTQGADIDDTRTCATADYGLKIYWYLDSDSDGYYAERVEDWNTCPPSSGFNLTSWRGPDCDDTVYSLDNNCATTPPPCPNRIVCPGTIVDCECVTEFTWYLDNDGDGWYSSIKKTSINISPGPKYSIASLGPDCADNNIDVYKLNKCGKCEAEPANGKCPCKTSAADLKLMFPNNVNYKNLETLADMINKYASDLGIDSTIKLQHLLSQTGHETGGFNTLQVSENLYYLTASLIPKSYSKFTMDTITQPDKLDARLYINNPEKLANAAMCCTYHNGPESSGDGWKYRGRGIMQLTWKSNYEEFQTWYNNKYNPDIDIVSNPDLISTDDDLAVLSGMWFFKKKVLNKIKDFDNKATVDNVTDIVNIRTNSRPKRDELFKKSENIINCNN